jgi:TRAP-type C4-dicarboxylate transport system substrate-binding protein
MKGKKIAHGGPMVPWINATGAVGVQSRLNEAYTCLQTGVYDGWAMEPQATVSFKMYEPARYYTLADLGAGIPMILTISLKTWNKLPKKVQDIVVKVGKDHENLYTNLLVKDYQANIDLMKSKGVTIYQLPESERMRFAKAMDDARVADVMAKESDKMGFPGSELSRFYIKAMSDDGYKWPFVPTIK